MYKLQAVHLFPLVQLEGSNSPQGWWGSDLHYGLKQSTRSEIECLSRRPTNALRHMAPWWRVFLQLTVVQLFKNSWHCPEVFYSVDRKPPRYLTWQQLNPIKTLQQNFKVRCNTDITLIHQPSTIIPVKTLLRLYFTDVEYGLVADFYNWGD
jgi:hypothetical protein